MLSGLILAFVRDLPCKAGVALSLETLVRDGLPERLVADLDTVRDWYRTRR